MQRTRSFVRLGKRPRRGVTLLEVTFSIGVVVIGLLGVIALVPLAAKYAEDGVTADRSAYYGRAMVEEFSLRGYARPDMWVTWFEAGETPSNTAAFYPLMQPGQVRVGGSSWFRFPGQGWTFSPPGGTSFCIDPRFIAHHVGTGASLPARYFPYIAGATDPRMRRISLRATPQDPNVPLTALQASNVFTSDDALSIQLPDDGSLEPLQLFSSADPGGDVQPGIAGIDDDRDGEIDNPSELGWPGTDDIVARRLAEQRLSWFATLVPRRNVAGGSGETDLYTLSIVVLKDRPSGFEMDGLLPTDKPSDEPSNERLVAAVFKGGPEVRLINVRPNVVLDPTVAEVEEQARAELSVESGQWIMLGAFTTTDAPAFRWYRISSANEVVRYNQGPDGDWGISGVDDDRDGTVDNAFEAGFGDDLPDTTGSPGVYACDVTLEGADWDRPEWTGRAPVFFRTQATIVTGVVHVQEKTVRLETSSLWNLGS